MKNHLYLYFIAQSFLTRLPTPSSKEPYTDKNVGKSVLYYPLVGLIIGLILSFASWTLSFANPMIVAVVITTLWVIITGSLHLDGLADSADAWLGGHGNKSKIFAIMQDPRLGTAGVTSLVLILLLKATSLIVLLENSDWLLIILIPVIARFSAIALIFALPTCKEEGLAYVVKQNLPINNTFTLLFILTALFIFLSPIIFIFSVGMLLLLRYMMLKQIGGMTGDTLGASIEIIEATGLLVAALLVS